MEYILIPTKDKTETAFFMSLLKKMQKQASGVSADEMEDLGFYCCNERRGKVR